MRLARECRKLRPALVARVYGEAHPQRQELRVHLASCEACRREEEELRETRDWSEFALVALRESPETDRGRRPLALSVWHALPAAAALVLLSVLFLGGRLGSGSRSVRDESSPGAWVSAADAPPTFDGAELDLRLGHVERRLSSLRGRPW